MRQSQLIARRYLGLALGVRLVHIAAQRGLAEQTRHRSPAKHLARPAQKAPARLDRRPLPFQTSRNRQIHHRRVLLAIRTKRMLLHKGNLNYFVTVSSRFSISLATMVQAASSGSGMDVS